MNKKTMIVSGVIILVGLIIGITYAYFEWSTNDDEKTNVTITVDGLNIIYEGGQDITNVSLYPTLTKEEGIVKTVTISLANSNDVSVCADFNLELTTLPSELAHESFKYEVYQNTTLVSTGNFKDQIEGNTIKLGTSQPVTTTVDTYTIYIWIDGNMDNPIEMTGKSFSFKLNVSATEGNECNPSYVSIIDTPVLPEGMIAIQYDELQKAWVKAEYGEVTYKLGDVNNNGEITIHDGTLVVQHNNNLFELSPSRQLAGDVDGDGELTQNDADLILECAVSAITVFPAGEIGEERTVTVNNWYDYDNKEWANAVMVTSDTRETYMNAAVGTVIAESDILGYFVYIPRYRYQLFNTEFETGTSPREIKVVFESVNTAKSTGDENGEWLTHPAFSFGSTELSGFWMAKFETSVVETDICYTSESAENCNKEISDLRILPNVKSLRYQQVAYQYLSAQNFGSTTYLTENGVNASDSHLMKNTEWGAVAYLSHSRYGLGSELYMNNSEEYYTGKSGGAVGSGVAGSAENLTTYGSYTYDGKIVGEDGVIGEYATDVTLGTNASTTGNIYGVYDMSGGTWERVMGNLEGYVGNTTANGLYSNFNGTLASGEVITDGIEYPEDKYVDKYKNPIGSSTDYSGSIIGDALGEVTGWYTDRANFIYSAYPWFIRGGTFNDGVDSGAFSSTYDNGSRNKSISFRPVLTAK